MILIWAPDLLQQCMSVHCTIHIPPPRTYILMAFTCILYSLPVLIHAALSDSDNYTPVLSVMSDLIMLMYSTATTTILTSVNSIPG